MHDNLAFSIAIIRLALGAAGFAFCIVLLQGWFLQQTHGGNEERKEEAAQTIKNGAVGVVAMGIATLLVAPLVQLAVFFARDVALPTINAFL
jgi:hypothetical protein